MLRSLTLEYNGGLLGLVVTVSDNGGVIFLGTLDHGDTFTIQSSNPGTPFVGNQVTINETLISTTVITTTCGTPKFVGTAFGNFTIVAGESNGGLLCCQNVETTPPVISGCPSDLAVSSGSSSCGVNVSWTAPTISDNCSMASFTSSHSPGDFFAVGTTPVTYEAKDNYGNLAACSFNVTVNDTTSPVVNGCPGNIVLSSNSASCGVSVPWTAPSATDNCSTVNTTSTHNPGDIFNVGTTPVTYTFTDGSGNSSSCSFDVMVVDGTPPVISSCPADIIVSATSSCGANVNWSIPSAIDSCSPTVTITGSHIPGAFFTSGTSTPVQYEAKDAAGNIAVCSFLVTVKDNTPPVFQNCPTDLSLTINTACDGVISWGIPKVTDNCGTPVLTSTHSPGDTFQAGDTEVTYTATDVEGNTSTCTFTVSVMNRVIPVINDCPDDIKAIAGESGVVSVSWEPPTANNTCGEVELTGSHEPGDSFLVGTTVVEYTATNADGNSVLCSFNVVVHYEDFFIDAASLLTPDGDGSNDQWIIDNIEKFSNNKVVIVDRWGSIVYQVSGYNNDSVSWNGDGVGGTHTPTGTYFYFIEVAFRDQQLKKKGFIELIR